MADVIVIGAGIGGLSAAIRLAAQGRKVILFEKNDRPGGKMGQFEAAGYRWDTGPSVITMRHVLDELFTVAGQDPEDHLTLTPLEPLTRYFYPDGLVFDATSNLSAMTRRIAALDERDVEGYLAYLAYAARLHRLTGPAFIYDQPPSLRSLLRYSPFDALRIDAARTMQQAIDSFVQAPQLRQLLGRFATYVGASPYQAPATLNVIAHVELTGGVWYPQGGIYRIAEVLTDLAEAVGVELHLNTPVDEILVGDWRVQGVRLANGRVVLAKQVLANVDVTTVYRRLLSPLVATPRRVRQLTQVEPSCSGFIMLLGVNRRHADLAHHNIFFSSDYRREFARIFHEGRPPDEPTIYVSITSHTDPEHAPPGHENWFVLVNAPALGPNFDWTGQAARYRDRILDLLADFGFEIRPHLTYEKIMTPLDIARQSGAHRGALYGSSSNNRFAAFLRPHNRAPDIAGLYFAGGTTHPGGGVPMVTLSGRVAADLMQQDA